MKEKVYFSDLARSTLNTKSLYDYSVEQRIANEEREKKTEERTKRMVFMWIGTIVLSIVIMCLAEKRVKLKKLHSNYQRTQLQLSSITLNLARKEKERRRLENIIRRQRAQQDANIEMLERDKRELEIELTRQQNKYRQKELEEAYLENKLRDTNSLKETYQIRQKLDNSNIVRFLHNFLSNPQPNGHISGDNWHELEMTINAIVPTFYDDIYRKRNLKREHYILCMLTLAGFSSYDICHLMEKSNSYASTVKSRLHKTLFGMKGTAEDFDVKIRRLL